MKSLIITFAALAFNANALNCPAGTKVINGTCKLVVNDKVEKSQMIKNLFEEGAGGETHHAVVKYTEKLLGKGASNKIKDINLNYQEPSESMLSRLWLKITGKEESLEPMNTTGNKNYLKKAWQSIFQPDTQ